MGIEDKRREQPDKVQLKKCPFHGGGKLTSVIHRTRERVSTLLQTLMSKNDGEKRNFLHDTLHSTGDTLETDQKGIEYALIQHIGPALVAHIAAELNLGEHVRTRILAKKQFFSIEELIHIFSEPTFGYLSQTIQVNLTNAIQGFFERADTDEMYTKLYELLKTFGPRRSSADLDINMEKAFIAGIEPLIHNTLLHLKVHMRNMQPYPVVNEGGLPVRYPKFFSQFSSIGFVYMSVFSLMMQRNTAARTESIDVETGSIRPAMTNEFVQYITNHNIPQMYYKLMNAVKGKREWENIPHPEENMYGCPMFSYFQEMYEIVLAIISEYLRMTTD